MPMADSGPLVDGCLAEQMSNEIRAMKIGLLTYHFVDNFGALMQAYALREWFLARGHSAEFIDYRPAYVERGGPFDRPWKLSLWRKNFTILYMRRNAFRRRAFANRWQTDAFEGFSRDHLGVVGPVTILYSGNLGLGHELETAVHAIAGLDDRTNFPVRFVG